jgi:hypothetical protein
MKDDQREKRDRKTTRRKGLTRKERKREEREREKEQGISTSKVRPLLFHIAFI